MAIQKVWLHGLGCCKCTMCQTGEPHTDTFIIFDMSNEVFQQLIISSKMSTFMKDQHGQMYIITPIPEYGD